MLWHRLSGGLSAGALPSQTGCRGLAPLSADPITTYQRKHGHTVQHRLPVRGAGHDNDRRIAAETRNEIWIIGRSIDSALHNVSLDGNIYLSLRPVVSSSLCTDGQLSDILDASSVTGSLVSSVNPNSPLGAWYTWHGYGAAVPVLPAGASVFCKKDYQSLHMQPSDGSDRANGCKSLNELEHHSTIADSAPKWPPIVDNQSRSMRPPPNSHRSRRSSISGFNTEGHHQSATQQMPCPALPAWIEDWSTRDAFSADPHGGVLYPLEEMGADRSGEVGEHFGGQGAWSTPPSSEWHLQYSDAPFARQWARSDDFRSGQKRQHLQSTRRCLGSEEFLHQYDALIEEQEVALAAAAKPKSRRSRSRGYKRTVTSEMAGVSAGAAAEAAADLPNATSVVDPTATATATADAFTNSGPGRISRGRSPSRATTSHGEDLQDVTLPFPDTHNSRVVGGQAQLADNGGINNYSRSTTVGRRPKHVSLYSEFELVQGAALGRMPPGSGKSAWDQMRPTVAAIGSAGLRPRARRSSSGAGGGSAPQASVAEFLPSHDIEEPWTPKDKADFWHYLCADEVMDEASGGVVTDLQCRTLGGTPVLICVRQPEPYGAAEVYELPDLGLGPMDEATWEAWGRLSGSRRPQQPLMLIDADAQLGFELCNPQCRGAGGWRSYEVVVGPGYSHDSARTLHPLRLVCDGRVRFDARHVWDLVDFLADPTRASVAAHLISAALLRTGRDRDCYYPPSFCHWLLQRRWGLRGLAHVGWGPADTLRHVNAVRGWNRRLVAEVGPDIGAEEGKAARAKKVAGAENCDVQLLVV